RRLPPRRRLPGRRRWRTAPAAADRSGAAAPGRAPAHVPPLPALPAGPPIPGVLMRYQAGLKWKIFAMLAVLGLCSQAFDLWHSARLINAATTNTEGGVKAILHHFLSFQQAMSQGHAAAADVWATTERLREALARGQLGKERPLLEAVRESLTTTLHPDILV